jgi:NADP-dependent 3-hydroxy acid dehydrogenase YdfG
MKTLVIFGAGPGLGVATARRFGREGFRIALVSRNADRLESFVDELAADGVEAAAFPAQLGDRGTHEGVVAAIIERFGSIDVAVINGFVDFSAMRPVLDIDVDSMQTVLEGTVLAPLSLVRLVLPGMVDRGDGALLFGLGASAKNPMPPLAAPGSGQASLRNYIHNLNVELAGKGVYAGALTIGALIEKSDAQHAYDGNPELAQSLEIERVEPADLAERYWAMYTKRERVEELAGAIAQ